VQQDSVKVAVYCVKNVLLVRVYVRYVELGISRTLIRNVLMTVVLVILLMERQMRVRAVKLDVKLVTRLRNVWSVREVMSLMQMEASVLSVVM
jgi:hypothetical protein